MTSDKPKTTGEVADYEAGTGVQSRRLSVNPGANRGARLRKILNYLIDEHLSLAELARRCKLSRQGMSLRFQMDDCKLSDMEKMAEAAGYEFRWDWVKKENPPQE